MRSSLDGAVRSWQLGPLRLRCIDPAALEPFCAAALAHSIPVRRVATRVAVEAGANLARDTAGMRPQQITTEWRQYYSRRAMQRLGPRHRCLLFAPQRWRTLEKYPPKAGRWRRWCRLRWALRWGHA